MDVTMQDPLVGRLVDERYLVESRIARGGMATVYRALDRRLDREVALKVMHDDLAVDEEFVARFVREARSAARLSHPSVVQVFDQGSDENVLYLAMEFLPGRTLRDVLAQRGALTPRESASVMEPVLSALGAAHRAGIVHRDVKPENVVLTDDGRIKVADFGLAGAVAGPVTRGGELLGTVAYLAPELVGRGVADPRTDVYAAGVMLFELLTGKQPFTGNDPARVAARHLHELVPVPSSITPGLPAAFDEVVALATAHDPDLRSADANEMLGELRQAVQRVPADQLDVRAADAPALRGDIIRTQAFGPATSMAVNGVGPAPAAAPQPTRALSVSRRVARRADGQGQGQDPPRPPMVPRLRVHDDEPAPPGFLGDRTRQSVAVVLAVVVVVVMIFTGVWWFTGGPGSYTTTPSLVGEPVADAQRILQTSGLTAVEKKVFSDRIAAGQVITTDPAGGDRVKKDGGKVLLSVSAGPELVTVPKNVKGLTEDDASAAIVAQRLKPGAIERKYDAKVDKGLVISSSPRPGSRVAPGREVDLVISKGEEPVTLDNVVGQNVDAARQLLESKGLKVKTSLQDYADGYPSPGTVLAQDPTPGSDGQTVAKGSTVTLTVVDAPDDSGSSQGQVFVPVVINQDFDTARQTLEGLGMRVNRRGNWGGNTVRGQNVQGLTDVGTEITLWVG